MVSPDPPSSAAFDDPSADLILISSDNIEFRVHRVILALASPVFRTMLSLPQPQPDGAAESKNEELPRVPVGESAVILEGMLRFWYPGATQPHISSITQLNEILEALIIKYEIEFIIPTAKYRLRDFIVSEPLASFAVAARYDWNDVALEAAKETLKLPLRQTLYPLSIEWRRVNGTVHHALTQYHQRCGDAVKEMARLRPWTLPQGITPCPHHGTQYNVAVYAWFSLFLTRMEEAFSAAPLSREANMRQEIAAVNAASVMFCEGNTCSSCMRSVQEILQRLITEKWWPDLKARIDGITLTL